MRSKKAVAIVSGGMDSVTLAYLLASEGFSRAIDPSPDKLGVRSGVEEDRNHGRSVEDDQSLLAGVARIVSIAHPTDS